MRVLAFHTFLAAVCMSLLSCVQKERQAQGEEKAAYDFSLIQRKINHWVLQGYYPGAAIIIAKDSEIIYEDYFGNYTAEDQVYIASAGKWLAAATIASAVEEGRLSWDDKVMEWLPEFTDLKGEATLRQLLSHTSGFPDYQPRGKHPDNYQTLRESVTHITALPADTAAGTEFHYGGLAMQVAGRMAELATGKHWEVLFGEKIAGPLQMTNTRFTPVDPTPGHNPMIGGAARSTLRDYARFLEMISNGGVYKGKRILRESSLEEMQSDQVRGARVHPGEFVEKVRSLDHKGIYGLGLWREELNARGEAVLISSPSWAGAYPWIDEENNIYGFFLAHVNVTRADEDDFNAFYASPELAIMVREVLQAGNKQSLSNKLKSE